MTEHKVIVREIRVLDYADGTAAIITRETGKPEIRTELDVKQARRMRSAALAARELLPGATV